MIWEHIISMLQECRLRRQRSRVARALSGLEMRRTLVLSTPLATKLELFHGRPWFNCSVTLVNSQLAYYVKLI